MSGSQTVAAQALGRSALARRWLTQVPLVLLALALVLRVFDIFVLRLDERLGEIILSKALGFVLVMAYVWWAGRRAADIGLHTRRLGSALTLGAGLTLAAFAVAVVAQGLTLEPGAALAVHAVDPKTGLAGGAAFAGLLILGNVVNSFMEEGLFRGIMLTHYLRHWRFATANLLQAALFAAWHLVWPLKAYLDGEASAAGAVAQAGLLLLGTFVAALVYGLLFWRTGSLWAPWAAHFLNNTILNLVQVHTATGELQPPLVLSIVVVIVLALLAFAVGPVAKRLALPTLQPWNAEVN